MKRAISTIPILFLCCFLAGASNSSIPDSIPISVFVGQLEKEINTIKADYRSQRIRLGTRLKNTDAQLGQASLPQQVALLIQKIQLQEELAALDNAFQLNLTKKRYRKGIDLIKMLYEKILALDHHFSSLHTYQNVMSLSNPNTYPDFQKTKELIEGRLKKDHAIKVPALFNANPYLSTTFSLVASVIGGGSNKEREADLNEIACILDFTASMNSELSTIFYETEFLKANNVALKTECLSLFVDYTKVIGYFTTLDVCRKEDDWEKLYETLDEFVKKLEEDLKKDSSPGSSAYKRQINLEFSVDRLLEFINKYNSFISQGEKYYKKFKIIVSNYPNEASCLKKLPNHFTQLQQDIDNSIYKFNEAYNISELTGSQLKDLLYGFAD